MTNTTQREVDERAQLINLLRNPQGVVSRGIMHDAMKRAADLLEAPAATDQPSAGQADERAKPDDIRAAGWAVAVHNDYRLNGEAHTFWLFTKDGRAIKGEGKTDAEALDQVRASLTPTAPRAASEQAAEWGKCQLYRGAPQAATTASTPAATDQPSAGPVLPPFEQDVHMVDECMRDCEPDDQRAWKRIRNVAMGDAISQMAQEALARASLTPTAPRAVSQDAEPEWAIFREVWHGSASEWRATTASFARLQLDAAAQFGGNSSKTIEVRWLMPMPGTVSMTRGVRTDTTCRAPQAATTASASVIKTWQERAQFMFGDEWQKVGSLDQYMQAEIRDLRAALARAPLPDTNKEAS